MAFFTTTEQVREYLPSLTVAVGFEQLAGFIRQARDRYLLELLGSTFLEEQEAAPAAALLPKVRQVLASYAYALYVPFGTVLHTSTGIQQHAGADKKSAAPAAVATLLTSSMADGEAAADALLEFLENHRDDYPTWRDSLACTAYFDEYIATATEFNRHVFIDRSRKRFRELVPSMRRADRQAMRPLIGLQFELEIKGQLKTNSLTAANQRLLDDYIRPAVASLAIEGDELRQEQGQQVLIELRRVLYAAPEDYPTWAASPAYEPTQSTAYENPPGQSFYAFV
jgi:hypothetical protein